MDTVAAIFLGIMSLYVMAGILVGLAFVVWGVRQVQPAPVTIGARILFLPAAVSLWPIVLSRWRKSRSPG